MTKGTASKESINGYKICLDSSVQRDSLLISWDGVSLPALNITVDTYRFPYFYFKHNLQIGSSCMFLTSSLSDNDVILQPIKLWQFPVLISFPCEF